MIGLGSMGKRRVRNLKKNGESEIFGFDNRKDRAEEARKLYGITTFTKFEDALKENPEVLVISCPPDKHMEYAYYAAEHNIHFFTEVNTDSKEKINELIQKINGKNIIESAFVEIANKNEINELFILLFNKTKNENNINTIQKL